MGSAILLMGAFPAVTMISAFTEVSALAAGAVNAMKLGKQRGNVRIRGVG